MAAGMTLLDVRHLELRREERTIVRDLSFGVARGDRVALMGASGTGKTTVLRAIAGLEPLSGGSVTVDGVHLAASAHADATRARELQRRVGMVFQFHHLFAHMTAVHNVWLAPVHVLRQPRAEAERRARTLLDRLGVAHRAEAMPHELSGGEAQRVAIARALAVNPPLLLMDEPTASLDPVRRGELASTLCELSSDGTTLLVATHDEEFARACVQRVLVLDRGQISRDGPATQVLS
jgi:ABC-type polar amino acid transport system ATPase subunit